MGYRNVLMPGTGNIDIDMKMDLDPKAYLIE